MYTLLIVVVFMLVLSIFLANKLKDKDIVGRENLEDLPYIKKEYLMTNAERIFFKVLSEAVGEKYYIVPQVPLKNVVQVNKYEKHFKTYQNKIDRKCLDFVLFDKEYFTPKLVIELDDSSHQLPAREERDIFVDTIMQKVGIKIKHVKVAHEYKICDISNLLQMIIN